MAKAHHCAVCWFSSCVSCRCQFNAGDAIARAFEQHQSNVKVEGEGTVTDLTDDNDRLPHQRFIVRLASGQTVLIEHNIDLAPRIDELEGWRRVELFRRVCLE
jgi:hypothetical protein